MRNRKLKAILPFIVAALLSVLIFMGVTIYYQGVLRDAKIKSDATIDTIQAELKKEQYFAWKSIGPISKGTLITEDMVISSTVSYSGNPLYLIESEVIGTIARVDVLEDTLFTYGMISEHNPEDFREKECSFIRLNSNNKNEDYVDVRIVYANGEDYVVLTKKPLKNVDLINNNTFLWINEEEVLLLDAAVVDASVHEGAFIYVTKYIDEELQDPSIVNYIPNKDVMSLIKNNPNIVEIASKKLTNESRDLLQQRLKKFTEDNGLVDSVDVKNNNVVVATPEQEDIISPEEVITGEETTYQEENSELETNFQGVGE